MKKLICLDLDNTLIYSDKSHILAYNYSLKKYKLKLKNPNYLKLLFGMPHHKIIEIIAPNLSHEKIHELMKIHDEILIKKTYKYSKAIPGIIKALKLLKKEYDLAVVSNASHKNILALLKGAKISNKLFKFIIGADDVKYSKPYPDEIFKAQKLEHNKADFMIGDSIYDILAGKKAKIKTIAVLTGNYSFILLKKQNPDYIIESVKDLPKALKTLNNNQIRR
jgi:HAD superfamily hydrolase (TIGR01549 family)